MLKLSMQSLRDNENWPRNKGNQFLLQNSNDSCASPEGSSTVRLLTSDIKLQTVRIPKDLIHVVLCFC